MEAKEELKKYIEALLTRGGFKKHDLKIKKGYGRYFIVLPHSAYSWTDMDRILSIFPKNVVIGLFPVISKSSISIKTDIKVK